MKIFSTNKSKLFQWQKIINKERKNILSNKSAWSYVNSFSKIITILWLRCWVLTVLASLVLSCINKGDALVLQWVNDNVVRIGEAILPRPTINVLLKPREQIAKNTSDMPIRYIIII